MAVVGGVGEVPDPLSVGNVMDKVEGRASDKLRTAMGEMEVGTEEMEEGDEVEAEEDSTEAEGGGG